MYCFGIPNKHIWILHLFLFGLVFTLLSFSSNLLEEMITSGTACFKISPATTVLKNSILFHDFSIPEVSSSTNYLYTNHFPLALKNVICKRSRTAVTAAARCEGEAITEPASSNGVLKAELFAFTVGTQHC